MYPNRKALLAQLNGHQPSDDNEASMLAELTAFVDAHECCFERAFAPGHVTASAWIVDASRTQALLVRHRSLGRWLQPGGHVEAADASVLAGSLREAREETGLAGVVAASVAIFDVDIHIIPTRGEKPAHRHYDVRYLLIADPAATLTCSDESHEVRWFNLAELSAKALDESIRRMVGKTTQS